MQLIHGSAHDLPMIADKSVQVIATSPPYFGLRKYAGGSGIEWPTVEYAPMPGLPMLRIQGCEDGCAHEWAEHIIPAKHSDDGITGSTLQGGKTTQSIAQRQPMSAAYCIHCGGWRGELGLEPTPEQYIAHLILCLREWSRVLRDDGTVWVNLGDSYAGSGKGQMGNGDASDRRGAKQATSAGTLTGGLPNHLPSGLKPKDLVGIPFRFAFAAQAEGWYLRSAITWCKSAAMPESVRDRPTKATEQIFLLSKNERYYYDSEAVKESANNNSGWSRQRENGVNTDKYNNTPERRESIVIKGGERGNPVNIPTRNMRDWQIINPQPFPGSHFAVFPERIPEIAILAGSSARGCCPVCGAGWVRVVERERVWTDKDVGTTNKQAHLSPQSMYRNGNSRAGNHEVTTTGWQPGCTCDADDAVPCVVLDPFSGSGTTGKVAARLGREYIGVDVSEEYLTDITAQRFGSGIQMEIQGL